MADASFNLNIGRDPFTAGTFFNGKVPEIIILKDVHPTTAQLTQLNN